MTWTVATRLTWKRGQQPGMYLTGPYRIERRGRVNQAWWYGFGPGFEASSPHKATLQHMCADAAVRRIGDGVSCDPVIGDAVVTTAGLSGSVRAIVAGRRGQITAILPPRGMANELTSQPLYYVRFARSRQLSLFRNEFQVVLP